jgi:hypothetical protein
MSDCELMPTCPYFNDEFQEAPEMTAGLKERYCRGEYAWCGRYMAFKALERERERTAAGFAEDLPRSIYK